MDTPNPNRCHHLALLDSLKEKIARANGALIILGNFDNEPELQAALDLMGEIEEARNALHRSLLATPDPAPAPANSDEEYTVFIKGYRTHIARFAKRLVADYNAGHPWATAPLDDLAGLAYGLSCLIQERQLDTPDAWWQVVLEFLPEITCHFGNPSQSDGNGGADYD